MIPFWFRLTSFYQASLACAIMRHQIIWRIAENSDPDKWKAHEDLIAKVYEA